MTEAIKILQAKFQAELNATKFVQKKYDRLVTVNHQLDVQLHENFSVQEELSLQKEGKKVFKMCGKVMLQVSLADAKSNIERRIQFIEEEIKRNNELIESVGIALNSQRQAFTDAEKELKGAITAEEVKLIAMLGDVKV